MRYTKPNIVVVGQSTSMIETKTCNKVGAVADSFPLTSHSDGAYEVDE
jgi:hypothetical protein